MSVEHGIITTMKYGAKELEISVDLCDVKFDV